MDRARAVPAARAAHGVADRQVQRLPEGPRRHLGGEGGDAEGAPRRRRPRRAAPRLARRLPRDAVRVDGARVVPHGPRRRRHRGAQGDARPRGPQGLLAAPTTCSRRSTCPGCARTPSARFADVLAAVGRDDGGRPLGLRHRAGRARRARARRRRRPGSGRCGSASTSCCRSTTAPSTRPRRSPTNRVTSATDHRPGDAAARPADRARRPSPRSTDRHPAGDRHLPAAAAPPARGRPDDADAAGRSPAAGSCSASDRAGWRRSSPRSACRSTSAGRGSTSRSPCCGAAWAGGEFAHAGPHFPFARVHGDAEPGATSRSSSAATPSGRCAGPPGWPTAGSAPATRRSTRRCGCAPGSASCATRSGGTDRCRSTCAWPGATRTSWPATPSTASSTSPCGRTSCGRTDGDPGVEAGAVPRRGAELIGAVDSAMESM